MGEGMPVALDTDIPPFATLALDVAELFRMCNGRRIEVLAGRHVVRPRYEVQRGDRTRIAHVNVSAATSSPMRG